MLCVPFFEAVDLYNCTKRWYLSILYTGFLYTYRFPKSNFHRLKFAPKILGDFSAWQPTKSACLPQAWSNQTAHVLPTLRYTSAAPLVKYFLNFFFCIHKNFKHFWPRLSGSSINHSESVKRMKVTPNK